MTVVAGNTDWGTPGLAQLLEVVLDTAARGTPLNGSERRLFFEAGSAAADADIALSTLIDNYLQGAGQLWEHLFDRNRDPGQTVALSRSLRQISETAVASLAEGFESTQRRNIRVEETARRELIDRLLHPTSTDPAWLDHQATQVDFPRMATYTVVVAGGDHPLADHGPVHSRIQRHLTHRYPMRQWVTAAVEGRLVVITGGVESDQATTLHRVITRESPGEWVVGIGEPAAGIDTIHRSYRQGLEALELARMFALGPTVRHADLLIPRLIAADPTIVAAIHEQVLAPLADASESLIETLEAFVEANGNMAEVARSLSIATRTVSYRLDRIAQVTGHSTRDPDGRLTLELAIRSRRLDTDGLTADGAGTAPAST